MKQKFTWLIASSLSVMSTYAQIGFEEVNVEDWVGSGAKQTMFVVDFGSSPIGSDSAFAWGVNFETDSINGAEILAMIDDANSDFSFTTSGGFLANIFYTSEGQTYSNPNEGWFSILESNDGEYWEWNLGIFDNIGDGQWYGIVAMNTLTYEAEINVPLLTYNNEPFSNSPILVYPNPATDKLMIDLSEEANILMMNWTGKVVFEDKSKILIIDISDFSPGLYVVKFVYNNNTYSRKIIIQ